VEDELLLLGLLSGSAMHGYQLNEIIEQRLPMLSKLKPSTAYSALDRLAAQGLAEATVERVGRRPERKVYGLTPAGRERFLDLLRENLRSADLPAYAGDRGLLFHRALPANEVLALLAERREATLARAPRLRRLLESHPPRSAAALVAGHALALIDAEVTWLDGILGEGLDA